MENLIFGLGVMVIGLLVVFLGLIILIVFIKVLSIITEKTSGEKKPVKVETAAPVTPPPAPVAAPAVQEGVSAEVIAAVSRYEPSGSPPSESANCPRNRSATAPRPPN